jgi:hypothetical protein
MRYYRPIKASYGSRVKKFFTGGFSKVGDQQSKGFTRDVTTPMFDINMNPFAGVSAPDGSAADDYDPSKSPMVTQPYTLDVADFSVEAGVDEVDGDETQEPVAKTEEANLPGAIMARDYPELGVMRGSAERPDILLRQRSDILNDRMARREYRAAKRGQQYDPSKDKEGSRLGSMLQRYERALEREKAKETMRKKQGRYGYPYTEDDILLPEQREAAMQMRRGEDVTERFFSSTPPPTQPIRKLQPRSISNPRTREPMRIGPPIANAGGGKIKGYRAIRRP